MEIEKGRIVRMEDGASGRHEVRFRASSGSETQPIFMSQKCHEPTFSARHANSIAVTHAWPDGGLR